MLKKLSAVAASIVAFAFIIVSITHACSGLVPIDLAVQHSPMNMGGGNNPPCSKEKGDICQSVRDSILSVKPSVSEAANPRPTAASVPLFIDSPALLVFSPVASVIESAFHPVFKLPLTLSYLVLRI
jgi:hypothetical protein